MPYSLVAFVWAPQRGCTKALVDDILKLRAREHWVLNHGGRSQSLGRRALVQVSQPWLPCLTYLAQLIELVSCSHPAGERLAVDERIRQPVLPRSQVPQRRQRRRRG
jgi:hypothetical protein